MAFLQCHFQSLMNKNSILRNFGSLKIKRKEDTQSFHYALTIHDKIKRTHPFVLNKNTCKYQSVNTTRHYNFKGHV